MTATRSTRKRKGIELTLSVEARAALEKLAAGPPREDMSRVVERLLLAAVSPNGGGR